MNTEMMLTIDTRIAFMVLGLVLIVGFFLHDGIIRVQNWLNRRPRRFPKSLRKSSIRRL